MAHGAHGGGGAPAKPKVPPEMQAFLAARLGEQDLPALDSALEQEASANRSSALAQNLSRAASIYRGGQAGPMAVPKDNALRDFVMRKQAEAASGPQPLAPEDDPNSPLSIAHAVRVGSTPEGKAQLDELTRRGVPHTARALEKIAPVPMVRLNLSDPQERALRRETREDEQTFRDDQAGKDRDFRRGESVLDRGSRERAAALSTDRQERRVDLAEKREGKKEAASTYLGPDFAFGSDVPPGAVPDSKRAELMNEAGLVNHLADAAQTIRRLVRQHGTQVLGKAAQEIRTNVEHLTVTAKDPIYNLGVLNGKDYDILRRIISDPTSISQIAQDAAGIRDLDKALETASRLWRDKVTQRMRGFGAAPTPGGRYAPKAARQAAPAAPASAEAPQVVERRRTRDGRVLVKYADGRIAEEGK